MTTGTSRVAGGADSIAPAGWSELRADGDIQFAPVQVPPPDPPEPSWFEPFFNWLRDLIAPLGEFLGISWPILRWILIGLLAVAVLFLLWRIIEPMLVRAKPAEDDEEEHWQPEREAALALLEDADRLAAEGRFDEATHLLLQRSIHQISSARPDWVEPSSTARELAVLPTLSDKARGAFSTISERVERSLFALRPLDRQDWDAARAAYADFALIRIGSASA